MAPPRSGGQGSALEAAVGGGLQNNEPKSCGNGIKIRVRRYWKKKSMRGIDMRMDGWMDGRMVDGDGWVCV